MVTPGTVSDAIAAHLRTRSGLRGFSGAGIARALNVDPLWVTRRLSGTIPLTVEDLFTICDVIGAHAVDLVAEVSLDLAPGYADLGRQSEVDTESTETAGPVPEAGKGL